MYQDWQEEMGLSLQLFVEKVNLNIKNVHYWSPQTCEHIVGDVSDLKISNSKQMSKCCSWLRNVDDNVCEYRMSFDCWTNSLWCCMPRSQNADKNVPLSNISCLKRNFAVKIFRPVLMVATWTIQISWGHDFGIAAGVCNRKISLH